MTITTCTRCQGDGRVLDQGCQVVCPDCLGVGQIKVRPTEPNLPPILARFAGSLTGMAGGTVIKPTCQKPR
jgi:DnaJ-class molecular chaperone